MYSTSGKGFLPASKLAKARCDSSSNNLSLDWIRNDFLSDKLG